MSVRDFLLSFGRFVLGILNRRPATAAGRLGFAACFAAAWLLLAFCPSPLGSWREVWPLGGTPPCEGRPPMAGGILLLWAATSSCAWGLFIQGLAVGGLQGALAFLMAKVVCHRNAVRRKVVVPRTRRDRARHRIRVRQAGPGRQARRDHRGARGRMESRRPAAA